MIDTDKYEGHTPGPWVAKHDRAESEMGGIVIYDRGWVVYVGEKDSDAPRLQNSTFGREELNGADARLIADAPLLLAEVKQLREQMDSARDWVRSYEDEHMMSSFKIWIGEEE